MELKHDAYYLINFSNSDDNPVPITLTNNYPFKTSLKIVDELPAQFQKRDFDYETAIEQSGTHNFEYQVKPVRAWGISFLVNFECICIISFTNGC